MKNSFSQWMSRWFQNSPDRKVFYLLFLLGGMVYASAIRHPFVHDDIHFLVENPALRHFDWRQAFFHSLDMGVSGVAVNLYYRPLVDLVNHWQYLIFSLNPYGFHLFNICLHILNSFLVYLVAVRVLSTENFSDTRRRFAAFVTAAVFLVHPVQTQAVACVSGISNLLFVFFGLSAFLFYLGFRSTHRKRPVIFYALSLVFFGLALLAKEQALVLMLLVAWYELCFSGGKDKFKTAALVIGWFAVGAAYLVLKQFLAGSTPLIDSHTFNSEFWLRAAHIPHIVLINLGLIVCPADLHYFRSVDTLDPAIPFIVAFCGLVIAGPVVYRKLSPDTRRITVFGAGWFLLSQVLTINILPLIWEYSTISVAEHFMYLPMIGVVLPLAAGSMKVSPRIFDSRRMAAAWIFLIVVFMALTVQQNTYWRSEVALFERAVQFQKNFGRLESLLGRAYHVEGRYPEAIQAYQRGYARHLYYEQEAFGEGPRRIYRIMLKRAAAGLAASYQAMGDFPTAELYFLRALEWVPDDPTVHNDFGVLYSTLGKSDLALEHFRIAFEQESDYGIFVKNYAVTLMMTGHRDEAENILKQRLSSQPDDAVSQALLRQIRKSP